jgi:hypothetical protein
MIDLATQPGVASGCGSRLPVAIFTKRLLDSAHGGPSASLEDPSQGPSEPPQHRLVAMEATGDLRDHRSGLILETNLRDRVRPLSPRTLEQAQQIPRANRPQPTEDLARRDDLLIGRSPRHDETGYPLDRERTGRSSSSLQDRPSHVPSSFPVASVHVQRPCTQHLDPTPPSSGTPVTLMSSGVSGEPTSCAGEVASTVVWVGQDEIA